MPVRSRPWRIAPVTTVVRMERRWGMEACWCGRVCAQAECSTPEVSNEPQAGGLMAEWNARPTMCVYSVSHVNCHVSCSRGGGPLGL